MRALSGRESWTSQGRSSPCGWASPPAAPGWWLCAACR